MTTPSSLAHSLALLEQTSSAGGDLRVCLIVAHPDDEVIGAGAQLPRWRQLHLVHVTDGAPLDGQDAQAQGFASLEEYARARHSELEAALNLAGLATQQRHELRYTDKTVRQHLAVVSRTLATLLAELQPAVVLTHPYEGGHPDHDATAFAVRAACDLLQQAGQEPPVLLEMACYHAGNDGRISAGTFLPLPNGGVCEDIVLTLSQEECAFKQRLYDCFPTQGWILANFPIGTERFRLAPGYDFSQPPHQGILLYENYGWDLTGEQFTQLAIEALAALGLRPIY